MRLTRWIRQTGLVPDVQTIEILLRRNGFFSGYYTSSRPAARTFFQELLWRNVSNSRVLPGNVVFDSRRRG
jgi:hypothetical protein